MKNCFCLLLLSLFSFITLGQPKSIKMIGTVAEGIIVNPNASINSYTTTLQFTITAWIKLDSINKDQRIFHKQNGMCVDDYHFVVNPDSYLELGYNGGCRGDIKVTAALNPLHTQEWYHVATVLDGSPSVRKMRLYLNGILLNESDMGSFDPLGSSIPIVIGGNRHWDGTNGLSFSGNICEAEYYNVALSEAQIQDRMYRQLDVNGSDADGLIGYWPFNGDANDLSANNNDGTVEGTSYFIDEHPFPIVSTQTPASGQTTQNFGSTNIDFSSNIGTSAPITTIYYNDVAPRAGTLPESIVGISNYYWKIKSFSANFSNGIISVPVSTLGGVNNSSTLVWLRRNNTGEAWINIGGVVSDGNLQSITTFDSFGEYAIGTTGDNPLPVELTSFSSSVIRNEVHLKWETATEVNNYGFHVERKTNNSDDWHKIGFVNGNGNSFSPKQYSFIDHINRVGGKFYYRLEQIDNDGIITYSKVVEANVNSIPGNFELAPNFPNPFNPSTSIEYSIPVAAFVSLEVYNSLGIRVAILVNETKKAGFHAIAFDASSLSAGVYYYRLTSGNFHLSRKMILMR